MRLPLDSIFPVSGVTFVAHAGAHQKGHRCVAPSFISEGVAAHRHGNSSTAERACPVKERPGRPGLAGLGRRRAKSNASGLMFKGAPFVRCLSDILRVTQSSMIEPRKHVGSRVGFAVAAVAPHPMRTPIADEGAEEGGRRAEGRRTRGSQEPERRRCGGNVVRYPDRNSLSVWDDTT